jgi:hypothetical protein
MAKLQHAHGCPHCAMRLRIVTAVADKHQPLLLTLQIIIRKAWPRQAATRVYSNMGW